MADAIVARRQWNFKDMTGQTFGRLHVGDFVGKIGDVTIWSCTCECGQTTEVSGAVLRRGGVNSCGCLRADSGRRIGKLAKRHGEAGPPPTPEYRSWTSMRSRCSDRRHHAWDDYGGRGITVCERWLASYENFLADMGRRPSLDHTLERLENDKGYEPGNCVWATGSEQSNNRRSNRTITYDERTATIAEWARQTGIPYQTLRKRIDFGWDAERALTQPVQPRG